MRLLIVDDNPINLKLLRAQLELEGHEPKAASNGAEALRALRGGRFDGVVSDILMPEMDGYRFCIEVRKDEALRRLPFVLYTSTYNSPADRELAAKVGADAYISKPAPVAHIVAALRHAADRPAPAPEAPRNGDSEVLRQYNEVLIRKLEDKNLELERSLQRLEISHEIDAALIAASSPERIAETVLPRLRDLLVQPRVIVNLFDLEKSEAEWLVAAGRKRLHVGAGVRYPLEILGDLDALKRGEMQLVDVRALRPGPEAEALLASGVRWFMVAPMIVGGELIGGLSFGGADRDFPAETLDIAARAAAQLAVAIHQSRLDARAREADAQYRMIFENVPLGITLTGADGKVVSGNQVMARMLGYDTVEEAIRVLQDHAGRVYADPSARLRYVQLLRENGTVRDFQVEMLRRDGARFWASLDGRLIETSGGTQLVTIADDVTMRKLQEQRIARLSRVKTMHSAVNAAILRMRERQPLLDAICRIAVEQGGVRAAWVGWHDAKARRLRPAAVAGYLDGFLDLVDLSTEVSPEASESPAVLALGTGRPQVANDLASSERLVYRAQALERGYRSMMHLPLTVAGGAAGVLILYAPEAGFFDDDERLLLEELAADVSFALESIDKSARLDYLAYYDPVTGLANRSLFHDRLSHSLRPRGGDATVIAVALLDLERFRRVNETLGRAAGDALLRQVGGRLHSRNDSAARINADMFGIIMRGARGAAEVNRTLEGIIDACLGIPVPVNGDNLRVACRAGVVLYPADGGDADALLRNAEAALERSKGSGDRIVFYAPDMNARVADALAIENRLRRAVEQREFVLHYQPKVRLDTGAITGAEALIRWQDPERGLVPPGRFIPVLEETGLIVEAGRWALQQTFADLGAWAKQRLPVPRIAVNVSSMQLQRKDFVDLVIGEIERGGDRPELLELEVTESLVMRNVEESTRKLSILRGMGVTIAIDDFGTGYSSLAYLARLPLDKLKIDRSFVSSMASSGEATTLVTTMIELAHGLNLRVVAEGVETEEQARMLRLFRCDQAQGYLYGKPMPAGEFARLLERKTP